MRRRRWHRPVGKFLASHCQVRVRFQEVDSLRVAWHGHYVNYFEEGRNAFGREYEFGYQDILAAGYIAPLVHVELDYSRPARFDEVLDIETRMYLGEGARVQFTYDISHISQDTGARKDIAAGSSVQVFTDAEGNLMLTRPDFYSAFLDRWAHQVRDE